MSERARTTLLASLLAAVAFLPFVRGVLAGASLYFRDLSLHFFPLRRFALAGLQHGELRLWNPYVHEGVPLPLPALGYPLDLVGLASPHEPFLSLLLALHVPMGALFFFLLARGLGLRREAACGGALVYALGGFYLSTVNLYVYVQAAAWAPLVVLGLVRLLDGGGRRALAGTALAVAVALSTTGVEIVAQAILAGVWLGASRRAPVRAALRTLGALALATLLVAPVLVLVAGQLEGSARGQGFPADVVLAHSVHPFALVQTLVAGLFGNLSNLANEWWGQNFFPRGFPYVLSLYLGAVVLALAATGAVAGHTLARRLALLAGLALVVALGRWGGLGPLVEGLGAHRPFRFPVKAFFSVHLAVALLAGLGLQALADGRRARTLAGIALTLGTLLACAPLLPTVVPSGVRAFAAAFFPPDLPWDNRLTFVGRMLGDAAVGGLVALAAGMVALLAARGRVGGPRAAWLTAALVAADLLRTGAGLNPMVPSGFFRPSLELATQLPRLRQDRVFTCPVDTSPAYLAARVARGHDHEVWSFALLLETLSPAFNVPLGVPTALSPDLTMLVPTERLLPPETGWCRELAPLVPRLREAGVATVLSLDPLEHAELTPAFSTSPPRIAPLTVHAYRLRDPLPRIALNGPGAVAGVDAGANRLEIVVESDAPTILVVRDAAAPAWNVRVDGQPRRITELGRHRSLAVAAGRSRVVMEYRPRGLGAAVAGSILALACVGVLARRHPRMRAGRSTRARRRWLA